MRRTTLLSTLTFTLLLGACGKKPEPVDSPPAQAPVDAVAPVAAATPDKRMDVWQAFGPLVSGTYQGSCAQVPATTRADGAITLGADGKASAGAVHVDFRAASMALAKRARDNEGQYSAMVSVAIDANSSAGGMFLLQTNHGSQETQASFTHGDKILGCTGVSGGAAVNARPLYPTLLQLVGKKTQTIGCADMKNALVRKDADIALGASVIRIGAASFDMQTVVSELLTLSEGGTKLMYSLELPNQRTVMLVYDGAGKLLAASNTNDEKLNQVCFAQGT